MAIGKVERISSITSSNAVSAIDNTSKNLQNQIQTKEQNLNRLSTDSKLSREEKEKKRQELQKEIEELNRKLELMRLKQEEAEKKEKVKQEKEAALKKEEKTKENTSDDKFSPDSFKTENEESEHTDMSVQDVQNMLHTHLNLRNDLIENSADFDKQNTVRVLKTEIQQDDLRGRDTDSKKEDLQELREKENFWIEARNEAYQKQRETSAELEIKLSIEQ